MIRYDLHTPWRKWLTTYPNPKARGYGADDGQRGWVTHAVSAHDGESFAALIGRRAACGLVPPHGWGMDLFIDKPCLRCLRATGLACIQCKGTGYVGPFLKGGKWCLQCLGTGVRR